MPELKPGDTLAMDRYAGNLVSDGPGDIMKWVYVSKEKLKIKEKSEYLAFDLRAGIAGLAEVICLGILKVNIWN